LVSRRRQIRRTIKKLRHYLTSQCILAFRQVLIWLPFPLAFRLCGFLGCISYYILFRLRAIILANLKLAFGNEKSIGEINQIAKGVFRNAGLSSAEVLCWSKLGIEYLQNHVTIENPEAVLSAYEKGKGIIGLTAHLGNWEYMAAALALRFRIPFSVIAREHSNIWINRLLEQNRRSMGIDVIYRGQDAIAILRRLKRGEGLGILADQNIHGEGIMVNFFCQPAKTIRNLAELILRTGSPVVPIFIIRNKDLTTHKLIIENPLSFEVTGDRESDLKNISQTYTGIIESYIRRFPDQWMWMHDRWGRKKKH